jgi:hypothetical protein
LVNVFFIMNESLMSVSFLGPTFCEMSFFSETIFA